MGLSKKIQISESKSFTIRADAVNFLNNPFWDDPVTDINSPSFGRITALNANNSGARRITIAARVDF